MSLPSMIRAGCMLVLLTSVWGRALAQSATSIRTTGRLHIRVVDESDLPVAMAEVQLDRRGYSRLDLRTDSAGIAQVLVAPGTWTLGVRRLGFTRATANVEVDTGDTRLTVQVERQATRLAGMKTEEDMPASPRLGEFERRRALKMPSAVITRADIDRVNSPVLSRMLRGVGGLRIADSVGSIVAISGRGNKPSRINGGTGFGLAPCVMRMMLDGVLLPPLSNIDAIVPGDVHGIEVYNGPARLPPELAGLRTDNWCGVIAIWTRDR
ncbi:MAG: hypothetical protein IBJ03_19230 [Gemmatimonadaceae bacterium]|nr:hypothetical protein [Gemmatimonadaceae bacterium]